MMFTADMEDDENVYRLTERGSMAVSISTTGP